MSTPLDDQSIIDGLRALMKKKKISVRTLAEQINIPYRTLQNYLTGATRFPVSVFLAASEALGLERHYIVSNSLELSHWDLHDAILTVFGDLLDRIRVDEKGNILEILADPVKDGSHKAIVSSILAGKLSKEYARFREDSLLKAAGLRPPNRISDLEKKIGQ
jgi:transcriptional regulator with XRE-family HTH domain